MKCKQCESEGLRSTVTPHGGSTTCLGSSPYYDEDGVYHDHDPNWMTEDYSCSNGHTWEARTRSPCPAAGCDFGLEAKP